MQADPNHGIVPVMLDAAETSNSARAEVGRAFAVFLLFYAALAGFALLLITLVASGLTALWTVVLAGGA